MSMKPQRILLTDVNLMLMFQTKQGTTVASGRKATGALRSQQGESRSIGNAIVRNAVAGECGLSRSSTKVLTVVWAKAQRVQGSTPAFRGKAVVTRSVLWLVTKASDRQRKG